MQLTTAQRRLFLRWIYKNIGADTLEDALWDNFATDRINDLVSGKSVSKTEGEGWATEFRIFKGFSPADILELAGQLVDEYDTCLSLLGGSATDAAIYAEMLDRMQPVTQFENDYSTFGIAATGGVS